jgi:dolichol-phosphate mannosyltransferase
LNQPRCSIVMPARNEGPRILNVLNRIREEVQIDFECLIVIDEVYDSTFEPVQEYSKFDSRFRILVNNVSPGPAGAIKYGIDNSCSTVVVVTMADGSDDPTDITELVKLVERGVVIAAASRYMPGGQQVGAPFAKSSLSRLAGVSLNLFRRVGTNDATNSFKAYSLPFLKEVQIESIHGFEIAIELVAKAKRNNLPVAEVPTIWLERSYGNSSFKVWRWLPRYLKWYLYAFGLKGRT